MESQINWALVREYLEEWRHSNGVIDHWVAEGNGEMERKWGHRPVADCIRTESAHITQLERKKVTCPKPTNYEEWAAHANGGH